MPRRDDPYDDWDWLGVFQHDSRPAEGCLRFLPTLVLLTLVFAVLVAPVWTAYQLGRGTLREKGWLVFLAVPLTFIVAALNVSAALLGAFHLATVVLTTQVRHNPFITTAMLFSGGMLTTLLIAFWVGRRDLRLARLWQGRALGSAITRRLRAFRRASFAPQPDRR